MKKIIGILCVVVALCLTATVVSFAATADIVHTSVEGTAVVDGVKDDAYANALALDFVQKGTNNGGGETLDAPIATSYIINDAEWVYVYTEVIDSTIDNTSGNAYERDSVEVFWMSDNSKNQMRFHYDGAVDEDMVNSTYESVATLTDNGYAVEVKFPITDVKANQIEMCLQINYASAGVREYTCYIANNADADDAYQRNSREASFDCWWTLTLAGEHADTRVEKADEPMEINKDTYLTLQNAPFSTQLFSQDVVSWGWVTVGAVQDGVFGQTLELNWEDCKMTMNWGADKTNDFTSEPKFRIQVADGGFLKLPEGAVAGDTGDTARYSFDYTDITIKADGYNDVIVPGGSFKNTRFTIKQENGYTSGTAVEIDLVPEIKAQLGLADCAALCEYLKNVTAVSTTITFTEFEGRTVADLDAFLVELNAEDEAKIAELQEYIDRVTAAQTIVDDEATDLTAKQEAVDDAKKAANRAVKEAEGYTKATETANGLVAQAEAMAKTVEELAAPAEPEVPEEEPKDEPADATPEEPAAEEGGNTGLIVGIIIAVVAVAIILVVVLGKKKKA